eukprot:TRINITY_DN5500_c0_g1_i1.p1 TRINITY_DN5500_c0_g1~~TRINITY_DN5500_c0_g1_i1.p1  ORF type:complete len:213 (+),score=64.41 TRINITY_DN5500_c0_g1_i1:84-641(+)
MVYPRAVAARAASLRGAKLDLGPVNRDFQLFDDQNKPTTDFWIALGVVLLLVIIILICCCRGGKKTSASASEGRPGWVGVKLSATQPGQTKTYKGARVAEVDGEHPSHKGGKGLMVNDDIVSVQVAGEPAVDLRSNQPGVSRDRFGEAKKNWTVGQKVTFTVLRGGKEVRVTMTMVDKSTAYGAL